MNAIVTDVEGTITSIAFVKDVLFPYARREMPGFVRAHAARADVAALLHDVGAGLSVDEAIAVLLAWIDEDKKATPLKALQGMIWAGGYAAGALRGHVYPDAVAALRRWHAAGVAIYIYSSGSVEAQRLLLRHAEAGDLTPLVAGHFDTRVGAKGDVASYLAIAAQIGRAPADIRFFSDTPAELAAAAAAGWSSLQICRDGLAPDGRFAWAASFADLSRP